MKVFQSVFLVASIAIITDVLYLHLSESKLGDSLVLLPLLLLSMIIVELSEALHCSSNVEKKASGIKIHPYYKHKNKTKSNKSAPGESRQCVNCDLQSLHAGNASHQSSSLPINSDLFTSAASKIGFKVSQSTLWNLSKEKTIKECCLKFALFFHNEVSDTNAAISQKAIWVPDGRTSSHLSDGDGAEIGLRLYWERCT